MERQYYRKPIKSKSPLGLTAKQVRSGLGPTPMTMYTPIVESLRNFKWSGSCLNSLQARANGLSSFRVTKQTKKVKAVSEGIKTAPMSEGDMFRQEIPEALGQEYPNDEGKEESTPCFHQNILRNRLKLVRQNEIGGFYKEAEQQEEYSIPRDNQSRIHPMYPSFQQSSQKQNYYFPVAQSFEDGIIYEQDQENVDPVTAMKAFQLNTTNRNNFQPIYPAKDSYPTARRVYTAYHDLPPLSMDEELARNNQHSLEEKQFIKPKINKMNAIISAMRQKEEEGLRAHESEENCQVQQEYQSQFVKMNHGLHIEKHSRKPSVQHSENTDDGQYCQRRNSKSTRQSNAGRDPSVSTSTQESFYQNVDHMPQLEKKRQNILEPVEMRHQNNVKAVPQFTNSSRESKNMVALDNSRLLEDQTKWAQQQQSYLGLKNKQSNEGYYDGKIIKCKMQSNQVFRVKRVKKNTRTNSSFEQQNEFNMLTEVINERYKKQNSLHCYLLQSEWDLAQGKQELVGACNQDWNDTQFNNNMNVMKSRNYFNSNGMQEEDICMKMY